MSHSTVYGLWPGTARPIKPLIKFRNAWGMAPLVWHVLAKEHLRIESAPFLSNADALWKLDRPGIPTGDRALLRMTFDLCYIRVGDVPRAINDIAVFLYHYKHHINPNVVNYWPSYADALVTQWQDAPLAFGVHQTSVSDNPWHGPYNEQTENYGPLDWTHAESVYEEL